MVVMKNKYFQIISIVCTLFLGLYSLCYATFPGAQDQRKNSIIALMIAQDLPKIHFSDKIVDDDLARNAFDLYLKQLDFQKRFLLKSDVQKLRARALDIDDNLAEGTVFLPGLGYDLLNDRINEVDRIVARLLEEKIDPQRSEQFETDPEKIDYVVSIQELEKRWRKILRVQLNNQYIDLEEENAKAKKKKQPEELWQEAYKKVAKRHKNFFHRLQQETPQDHYDRFFNAVTRAFDPHTNYIAPTEKEQFDINMRGSLEGIGAMLREEDGLIKVSQVIPGSAAARQGQLAAEDTILEVAEADAEPVDITDMRLRKAVRLIRGPKGTEVRLTVRKADGAKEVIPIIRDVVQIEETFVKSTVLKGPNGIKVGYLSIPSFYRDFEKRSEDGGRNSSDDTRKAITQLKQEGVQGIVLDLRYNGGGALIDAVEISGMFLDSGPIVQVKNSAGQVRVLRDENPGLEWDGPLVVLVNKFSASASEIVAGAMQDYSRAVIIGGAHTHGKGTVQTIFDLNRHISIFDFRKYPDLGALKVMIQKFYRVSGSSTQYKGVEPDIVLPSLVGHIESGERYLEYSLPWDAIDPVAYTRAKTVFDLENLKKKSSARVSDDDGFQAMREEAAHAAERSKKTLIATDLDSIRKERIEAKAAREKLGAFFSRYRKDNDEKEKEKKNLSEKEKKQQWLKELREDPYICEAERVVVDILGR